jgi:transglutaminase-like putative cysteine protease
MIDRLVRVLLTGLLGGLVGLAFGPVFGGIPGPAAFLLAIAPATAVATATGSAAVLVRRLPPTVAGVGGAGGVLLAAVLTTDSGAAIVDGPWQLLTGSLPANPAGPPLAAATAVTGAATLAATLLAAYTARPLAPLVPLLVALLAALGLGASGPALPPWYAIAALLLVAGLLVTGPRGARSPIALGAATATAVAGAAAAWFVGPAAPGAGHRAPADARALVSAPVQPRTGVSPLQQYLALRDGILPLKLTGTTSRPGARLRLATLTRFDGRYWTVDGDFRRAGNALPNTPEYTHPVAVTQRIRIDAGDPDWIPTMGRPTRIDVAGLGVDGTTGNLVVPDQSTPPREYTASSVVNDITVDQLHAADPRPNQAPFDTPVPARIRSEAENIVRDEARGADQLIALNRRLAVDGKFQYDQAEKVDGGHGYYQIEQVLRTKRGTSEQYASAYAVMARYLGYEARVVMGFRPEYSGDGGFTVTGRNVDAWVEVNFAGLGWVTVDPSPRDNPIGVRADVPSASSQSTSDDDPLRAAGRTPPARAPDPQTLPDDATPAASVEGPRTDTAVVAGAGLLLLIVFMAFAPPAAKAVRRARRARARSTRLAVLGAWWETVDRLAEAGFPTRSALTTGEVTGLVTGARAGFAACAPGLRALGDLVDRAAYAPEPPSSAVRAHAWAAADEVRRRVTLGMHPARRVVAVLDPRSLVGNPRADSSRTRFR